MLLCPASSASTRTLTPLLANSVIKVRLPLCELAFRCWMLRCIVSADKKDVFSLAWLNTFNKCWSWIHTQIRWHYWSAKERKILMAKKILLGVPLFILITWALWQLTARISWSSTSDNVMFASSPIISALLAFYLVKLKYKKPSEDD